MAEPPDSPDSPTPAPAPAPGPHSDRTADRPDLLPRAEAIFFEVASLAPSDRAPAIIRLCAGDASLEREVQSLIDTAGRMGAFLDASALGQSIDQLTDSASPDPLLNAPLGPFTIERRLASGGMGTVYVARRTDGQFTQRVAIKVVKRGLDSDDILERFREERQILASLDHPNIARLLDAGATPDGRPYFVMEYIDGVPIDQYCDRQRLSIRDRLRLFRSVCAGVQAAHQALVIHRDLKPSNILVTPAGIPKLLDFGIAKLVTPGTASRVTLDTHRRLTPEYASPEQVEGGPITTASDVYSLGVILYELLTGARPYYFSLKTSDEVQRVVCTLIPKPPSDALTLRARDIATRTDAPPSRNADPATPPAHSDAPPAHSDAPDTPETRAKTRGASSTRLRSQLRGDLDTIVLMALRKEPARRYASSEALAADIERYLKGLPVQARRDTLGYRAAKFIRRHALGVSATAVALALLSGATIVLARQAQTLARQRDELRVLNIRALETKDFLVSMFAGAETGDLGPATPMSQVIQQSLRQLDARTTPPGAAASGLPQPDPLLRASMQQAVGRVTMQLGMYDSARSLLESAKAAFDQQPAASTAPHELAIRLDLAELSFFEGKHADAEAQLRTLLAAVPAADTRLRADILNDLGACLRLQGKHDQSVPTQREALALRQALGTGPTLKVAESLNNLGTALLSAGQTADALEMLSQALAMRRQLLRATHPMVLQSINNLGVLLVRQGDGVAAEPLLREAAQHWPQEFGDDHPAQATTRVSLGQALRLQGKNIEAIEQFEIALAWQTAHLPATAPQLDATRVNIALSCLKIDNTQRARELLTSSVPALEAAGPSFARIAKLGREALDALPAQGP